MTVIHSLIHLTCMGDMFMTSVSLIQWEEKLIHALN